MTAPDPLVLVTGAAGFIGRALARKLRADRHLGPEGLLLTDQVIALTQERDLLRLRLQAARARVDALIERLPANQGE